MVNRCFSKKAIAALVLIPVFAGLISLGLRLPVFTGIGKGGPKPRPRALLQNQIKTCKEKIEKSSDEIAGRCVSPLAFSPPILPRCRAAASPAFAPPAATGDIYVSRAPPISPQPLTL